MRWLHLLASVPATLALSVVVNIPSTPLLPNPSTLPPTTHATLLEDRIKLDAPLTRANSFIFHNVSPGSYLFNVFCRDYSFETLRIDVSGVAGNETVAAWQTFMGNEWTNKGEKRDGVVPGTLEVRPTVGRDYYMQRQGFSVFSFLKSPMILMALFSLVMIVGMPYLMENMDPEAKAEFEEMQKSNPLAGATNPSAALQNFDLASWMAGANTNTGGGETNSGSSATDQGNRSGGGANRRR